MNSQNVDNVKLINHALIVNKSGSQQRIIKRAKVEKIFIGYRKTTLSGN